MLSTDCVACKGVATPPALLHKRKAVVAVQLPNAAQHSSRIGTLQMKMACICSAQFLSNDGVQDGRTALHKATYSGHHDMVQLLVRRGAAVNVKDKVRQSV